MNLIPTLNPESRHECWIPTLQLAAQEVFDLMLGSHLQVPSEPPEEKNLEITSMVGMAGQLSGILAIRCDASSATRMASRMLGIGPDQAGPETWDAVGEICNMIAGNFKNKINGLGDGCMLSVPTVITGADYNLRALVDDELRTILIFEGQPIVLSLEIHS